MRRRRAAAGIRPTAVEFGTEAPEAPAGPGVENTIPDATRAELTPGPQPTEPEPRVNVPLTPVVPTEPITTEPEPTPLSPAPGPDGE